jgi:hypothetical protein
MKNATTGIVSRRRSDGRDRPRVRLTPVLLVLVPGCSSLCPTGNEVDATAKGADVP